MAGKFTGKEDFMEQKKTLWIIAAAGVFLLVVLGAACILYSPASKPYSTIASVSPVEKKTQAPKSGWTNPPVEPMAQNQMPAPVPEQQDFTIATKVSDMVVVADNAKVYASNAEYTETPETQIQGTTIDLNALKKELYQETSSTVQPQNINITVNIPEQTPVKETTYITTTPDYKPEVAKSVEAKPAPAPVTTKKVEKVAAVKTKTTSSKPAAPVAEAKPAAPKVTQFWVQVAAYSNKKGAEGARSVLDDNKIPADIFTFRDNKDKLFYRVRVGPYTTKSEAEYWRTKIVKIDDFAKSESYVTSTTN